MVLTILVSVILPIFLLIGLGALLDRRFKLDAATLSKLNFYVFVPALAFVKLLDARLPSERLASVGLFGIAHVLMMLALSWAVFSLPIWRSERTALAIGASFSNVGNYGIPFVAIAFGDELIDVVAILIVVQNLLTFTLGVWLMEQGSSGVARGALAALKAPVVVAVALALVLRASHAALPPQIRGPLNYLADGLIPVALLTLGVQLSRTKLEHGAAMVAAVSVARLVVAPLVAAGMVVWLFRFAGGVADVLIVSAGFPVAVNTYILAAEYRQSEGTASQAVFWTTLLSAITLTAALAAVR